MEKKEKLGALLIAVGAIIAAAAPLFAQPYLCIENNVSQNDLLVFAVIPAAVMLVFLAVPFAAVRLFGRRADFDRVWIQRPVTKLRWLLLLPLAAMLLFIGVGNIARYTGWPAKWEIACEPAGSLTLGILLIGAARKIILTPVAEEIFWRGFIQDQFTKCFGGWIALIGQAALFALVHRGPLLGFATIFGFGLIQGFWRMKRRSLVPIILTHAMVNAFFVLVHWPNQYAATQVRVAVNYVDSINRLADVNPEENAAQTYESALACYVPPDGCRDLLRKKMWVTELTAEQRQALEGWIADSAESLECFRTAAAMPVYQPEFSGTRMLEAERFGDMAQLTELAAAVVWRAKFEAENGRFSAAADEIACAMRFGNHLLEGARAAVWYVGGMAVQHSACEAAMQILDRVPPDSSGLASLQRELEDVFTQTPNTLDLTWEKYTLYDIIQRVFTDDGKGGGCPLQSGIEFDEMTRAISPGITDEQFDKWEQSDRKTTRLMVDELFAFYTAALAQPPFELHLQEVRLAKTTYEKTSENILYPYIVNVESLHRLFYQVAARRDALLTVLAILRYRDRFQCLPESLDALTGAGLLETIPIDPFSGQPLVYRTADGSFTLYSLGPDFDDDNASVEPEPGKTDGDYIFWPPGPIK